MTQENNKFALAGWLKTNKSLSFLAYGLLLSLEVTHWLSLSCVQQHLTLKAAFSVLPFPQFQSLTFIFVFTFSFIY